MKVFSYFYLIILFSLLVPSSISKENSIIVAKNHFFQFSEKRIFEIKNTDIIKNDDINLFYIHHLEPIGFVIVSADNRSMPILGYSFDNNLILEGAPENFNWLINNYKNQILYLISNNQSQENEIGIQWNRYFQNDFETREYRNVSPLLDAEFDQSGAWNNSLAQFGFYGPVGCVAVSMSQIMHYWSYPYQGEGFNYYNENDYGILEVDFSTAFYDYDNMASTYATSASQLLLYHTGISVNMDYDNSGSGASVSGVYPSAEYALENFFKFNEDIYVENKENYSTSEFRNILKNELNLNRPILYSGYTNSDYDGGHAWNIDGYQGNNMHCNWGWGGSNNGYFNLTSMGGFSSYQSALINIIPEIYLSPLALFEYEANDMTVTFIDLSEIINDSEIEYWNWDYGDGTLESNSYGFSEHTYNEPGDYQVSLSVTNIYGQTGELHTENITIGNLLIGDINSDMLINILDVVMLVNFVLGVDNPSSSELNAGDFNSDGFLNVLDIVSIVNIILN